MLCVEVKIPVEEADGKSLVPVRSEKKGFHGPEWLEVSSIRCRRVS